jgi:uroporphyrinogen-III synthase
MTALAQILQPEGWHAVLARVAIFAIGPTTADAVSARRLAVAGIAHAPTPSAMAAAFVKVYPYP